MTTEQIIQPVAVSHDVCLNPKCMLHHRHAGKCVERREEDKDDG